MRKRELDDGAPSRSRQERTLSSRSALDHIVKRLLHRRLYFLFTPRIYFPITIKCTHTFTNFSMSICIARTSNKQSQLSDNKWLFSSLFTPFKRSIFTFDSLNLRFGSPKYSFQFFLRFYFYFSNIRVYPRRVDEAIFLLNFSSFLSSECQKNFLRSLIDTQRFKTFYTV